VSQALKHAGQDARAAEFQSRLFQSKSYDEALALMQEYVEVT